MSGRTAEKASVVVDEIDKREEAGDIESAEHAVDFEVV